MKGYNVSYHDSSNDYYECRLIVSADTAVTIFARGCKGAVADLKGAAGNLRIYQDHTKGGMGMEMSSSEFQEKLCLMLRSLRIHAGLKQSDLADRLGMSNSQYVYYEAGKVSPDLFTLRRIAEILGTDASSFLYPERFSGPH